MSTDIPQLPNSAIIIAGTITMDPAQRAPFLVASAPLQAATLAEEPGCLAYVFSADPLHDDQVCVYELWTDGPSLDAHFQHPNYNGMRQLFGSHGLTGSKVAKYRVDAQCPVYGDDRIATARFW